MKQADAAYPPKHTTSAIGPNDRTIWFDDLVEDGEIVEVEGRRMVVRYDPLAPDWFVGLDGDELPSGGVVPESAANSSHASVKRGVVRYPEGGVAA